MPHYLNPNNADDSWGTAHVVKDELDYAYPFDVDLRPNSEFHKKLLGRILMRVQCGYDALKPRRESWRNVDKTLTAYVEKDAAEKVLKAKDNRTPVSIVFPHSYAILETLNSYFDSIFLADPTFRYTGNTPEDTVAAMLLEKVVQIHCKRTGVDLALHTMFRDSCAYGVGAGVPMWDTRYGYKTRWRSDGLGAQTRVSEPTLLFEGNSLTNIDPYLLILDPNSSVHTIQNAEFIGFITRSNYVNLLPDDQDLTLPKSERDPFGIFNVQYLKGEVCDSKFYNDAKNPEQLNPRLQYNKDKNRPGVVDLVHLYINIIPKDWGFGDFEQPEKWLFTVAGDNTIVQAQPLDLDHGLFPIALCSPTFDGYSPSPLGRLEIIDGMQKLMDWFFNSHVMNVRKTQNDMIVFDPFVINEQDLKNPGPGKLIRLRRSAFGSPVDQSIKQLAVQDITRGHVQDASIVMNMMNQVSGSDDAMMGSLRQGGPERLTAQEFQGTQSQAFGRLAAQARIIASQCIQPIGYMFGMHTQQLMSEDIYVQTVGELEQSLLAHYGSRVGGGMMKVRPQDLSIDFDVTVNSEDPASNELQGLLKFFEVIIAEPNLAQTFDISRLGRHILSKMGVQNVDSFLRPEAIMLAQLQTAATEQVMDQVESGQLIGLDEAVNSLGY